MVECERRAGQTEAPAVDRRTPVEPQHGFDPGSLQVVRQRSLFVDNARFWSILAIIALHSLSVTLGILYGPSVPGFVRCLQVWVKFGTIDFFVISGFLLGESFEKGKPLVFLRRRARKMLLPWAAWFLIMTLGMVVVRLPAPDRFTPSSLSFGLFAAAARDCLLLTPFWFVPNLLFSLCLLLLVRKKIGSLWLGGILLLITSFYTINIYRQWIPSSHMVAVGGFCFFLWLGVLLSRHFGWLLQRTAKIPLFLAILLVLASGLLSFLESELLVQLGISDSANTLRFSNQLYSFAVLLLVLKVRSASWPRFVDVRNQTFGVYLSHSLVLSFVLRECKQELHYAPGFPNLHNLPGVVLIGSVLTAAVFGICTAVTRFFATHGMGWVVGDLAGESRAKGRPQRGKATSAMALIESA